MDPVTGIGLAASVIQLVTFCIDAGKKCQEIYQQGSVSGYNTLNSTTDHLASLTKSLQNSLQISGTQILALTEEEKDLVDLARKCEECANTLQKELHTLQTPPYSSALKVIRKFSKATWKKSTISRIQKQLETCRSTLEISLLSRLSQKFDTQRLKSDQSFSSLDRNLQHLITCLAESQTSLSRLVVQKTNETGHCIATNIDRLEKLRVDDRRYGEIVNSLFFPDISSRQEQVENQFVGIKNTYDWIFDDPQTHERGSYDKRACQKRVRQWDDFAHWLKSGHEVYWINGKAGSGKSTLMNHLCTHERLLDLLGEWCSNRRLLTPTFFFWNSGSILQKTINGMLRSVLYQMLKECRDLIGCFHNNPLHTWTTRRLFTTLRHLITQSQVPIAICMIIDGLDECDGPGDDIIHMIKDLADQAHIKVCVSSRPLLPFEEAFSGNSSLRLQDLTFDSLRDYAEFKLSKQIQQYVLLDINDGNQVETLLDRIVERAEGVFLWAIIAIRDVQEGLQGLANFHELAQTVENLPSELENLFMLMLRRIKSAFKRDAAQFLGIVLYDNVPGDAELDLCRLHFIQSQRGVADTPFVCGEIATSELIAACRFLKTRLLSHTAGLLELTQIKQNRAHGKYSGKPHDAILFTRVNFLHRTARDFLLKNDEAKSFLALNGSTEAKVRLAIARGTLAHIILSQGGANMFDQSWLGRVFFPFRASLQQISLAEQDLGMAQSRLMRSLDLESMTRGKFYSMSRPTRSCGAYLIDDEAGIIDLMGMAAFVGMTIYVCEQLGLPLDSRSYSPSLPRPNSYIENRAIAATLCWKGDRQDRDSEYSLATRLRSANYRQTIAEGLQWVMDDPLSSRMAAPVDNVSLAETYLLSCCDPTCRDLAHILLRAGANPMVQIRGAIPNPCGSDLTDSFWHLWLDSLMNRRLSYINVHGKSGGILLDRFDIHEQNTLKDLFSTTKALLVHGADINYQQDGPAPGSSWDCLRRPGLKFEPFQLVLRYSAVFILQNCFNTEPELHEFLVGMEPLNTTPTREIVAIVPSPHSFRQTQANPCTEEMEMLWPLIEKWEETGHRRDLHTLQAALESVWRAHNPGVEPKFWKKLSKY